MALLKIAVVILVCFFIARAVQRSRDEFAREHFTLSQIQWQWLLLASCCYVLGMLPMGLNWHRLLIAMQLPVSRWDAVRTHFISQLGKYVPGKACVPAIRFALLEKYNLPASTALISMAAETLTMMAVGAVLGAGIVAVLLRGQPEIGFVAAGLALAAGVPVAPPVLRFALRWLQRRKAKQTGQPIDDGATRGLTWKAVLPGWLGIIPGWLMLGLSMWATMKALNLPTTRSMSISELPWVLASYAISVIAGFASMVPGGVGVREWVMKELIEPKYGAVAALLAPVLHRMMSLVSELLISSMLYLTRQRRPPTAPPTQRTST